MVAGGMGEGLQGQEATTGRWPQGLFDPNQPLTAMMLAFCACYVDVVCVLGLFHTFTAFVTGTLVVLCTEIFTLPDDAKLKLVVLATFIVATLGWYELVVRMRKSGRLRVGPLFVIEAVLLVVFMLVATLAGPLEHPLATATIAAVMISTFAMSLQNVIMSELLSFHAPTTFMTGNTMRLIAGLVSGWLTTVQPGGEPVADARARALQHAQVILAFVSGGLLAGFGMMHVGFWALLLPIAILLVMAAVQRPGAGPA